MYTQCPECQTAFRVTVEVLQKASGRVRCGGCEHAFSALDYLSDGVPGTASNSSSPARDSGSSKSDDFDAKSKALLETLDELAGPQNIRIEDTGIEWRVLSEGEDIENTGESQVSLELDAQASDDEQSQPETERRYDDDTELPDNFADEEETPYIPETPQRRATDVDEQQTDFDTHQVDMALDGDETWAQLFDNEEDEDVELETDAVDSDDELARKLEEAEARQIADDSALLPQLAESLIHEAQANDGKIPFDVEVELAAIHSDVSAISNAANTDPEPGDLDSQFNLQAEALGLDITRNDEANDEDDDDDLSAEEEAAIVQKLRDSTGSFQKQIQAAQQALDSNEVDEHTEEVTEEDAIVDEAQDEALELADDEDSDADPEEPGTDTELDKDDIRSQLADTYSDIGTEHLEASDDDDGSEEDSLSQTMIRAGIDPSMLDADNTETIIMEGDLIHGSSEDQKESTAENASLHGMGDQQSLVDTYMLNKGQAGGKGHAAPTNWGMIGGIAVLLFLLAAQYLHASRQTFATYGAFNQTIGPVYRALGKAVTPRWNIKGWQFERTSGSTDENDQVLTVFSTVRNTSDDPLPYPLVHLSLTDRWEDIIGSKILEPSEYLAGDMDPRTPVAPGESFTAVIAIERPSVEATGFQLYVCYRVSAGRVRCATEDFKE